jgi:hypothetical protein
LDQVSKIFNLVIFLSDLFVEFVNLSLMTNFCRTELILKSIDLTGEIGNNFLIGFLLYFNNCDIMSQFLSLVLKLTDLLSCLCNFGLKFLHFSLHFVVLLSQFVLQLLLVLFQQIYSLIQIDDLFLVLFLLFSQLHHLNSRLLLQSL